MAEQIRIGTEFFADYADGRSLWRLSRKIARDGSVWEATNIDSPEEYDGQIYPAAAAGVTQVFSREEIERIMANEKETDDYLGKSIAFWASQKVGETLYVNDGFDSYYRGKVIDSPEGHAFKAEALIGDWPAHRLPRWREDGSIDVGRDTERILESYYWKPHPSDVFGHPEHRLPQGVNHPGELPVHALTPPRPTAQQKESFRYGRALRRIWHILEDENIVTPKERVQRIQKALDAIDSQELGQEPASHNELS